jgi:hypothetical protein
MATKKQRRRREKDRRHEYEFVYYDEEGNEVEFESPEKPAKAAPERKKPSAGAARNGRAARPARVPKPPTWRSVSRMGVLMFALLFIFSTLLIRAPTRRLLGISATTKVTQRLPAGVARAYQLRADASGTLSSLAVYVDKSSKASQLVVGLYASSGSRPGKLLARESGSPSVGKWNSLGVPSKNAPKIEKGRRYWLAVLGTGGRLVGRETGLGANTLQLVGASASSLSSWSAGTRVTATLPSAYAGAKGSVGFGQRLLLPLIYTLILIPSIYLMQRMSYRSYQKRTGQLQRQPRGRKKS